MDFLQFVQIICGTYFDLLAIDLCSARLRPAHTVEWNVHGISEINSTTSKNAETREKRCDVNQKLIKIEQIEERNINLQ